MGRSYTFVLYVPWPRIKPTTLGFGDDALIDSYPARCTDLTEWSFIKQILYFKITTPEAKNPYRFWKWSGQWLRHGISEEVKDCWWDWGRPRFWVFSPIQGLCMGGEWVWQDCVQASPTHFNMDLVLFGRCWKWLS